MLLSEQDSYLFKLNEHLVRPKKHRFGPTSSPFVPKTWKSFSHKKSFKPIKTFALLEIYSIFSLNFKKPHFVPILALFNPKIWKQYFLKKISFHFSSFNLDDNISSCSFGENLWAIRQIDKWIGYFTRPSFCGSKTNTMITSYWSPHLNISH